MRLHNTHFNLKRNIVLLVDNGGLRRHDPQPDMLRTTPNCFTCLPDQLFHLNFHPLGSMSRYRDPQLQVGENDSYLDV